MDIILSYIFVLPHSKITELVLGIALCIVKTEIILQLLDERSVRRHPSGESHEVWIENIGLEPFLCCSA